MYLRSRNLLPLVDCNLWNLSSEDWRVGEEEEYSAGKNSIQDCLGLTEQVSYKYWLRQQLAIGRFSSLFYLACCRVFRDRNNCLQPEQHVVVVWIVKIKSSPWNGVIRRKQMTWVFYEIKCSPQMREMGVHKTISMS